MDVTDPSRAKNTGKRPTSWDRKKLLATALLLIMVVLSARAVATLYDEGDTMCRDVQEGVTALPSRQPPCSAHTYLEGVRDPHALRYLGLGLHQEAAMRYEYGAGGRLRHFTVDRHRRGVDDTDLDCSFVGKILVPLTNFRAWSSSLGFRDLASRAALTHKHIMAQVESPGFGVRTDLKLVGGAALEDAGRLVAETRNFDGQLVQMAAYDPTIGQLRVARYDYDASGNLETTRVSYAQDSQVVVLRTDYTYECWK